jgi:branched-chain amino acid transport system ATP-binding protein
MLVLKGVSRQFGGLMALNNVEMVISAGKIVGLIGPNGAGKTTLINCMTGLDHPTSGSIEFNGTAIHKKSAHRIHALGMARTYQNIRLFGEMTALENLVVAQHGLGNSTLLDSLLQLPRQRHETQQLRENALQLLKRFHLEGVADVLASNLPYGDQRRLEMARAMATHPHLILLDEPTAGMNPVETAELGEQILRMKTEGMTLMVVEHDMSLIAQVCDEIYVLNFGQMIAHGTHEAIKNNPVVVEAYLGQEEIA